MTRANKNVIQLKGLVKRYGLGASEHNALDGVDLEVRNGEFIAIMGPSGCGKTTLLNMLAMLDVADEGDYYLDDQEVERLSSAQRAHIRSRQIGIVFQNFNLIERLTVIENVALPLTYHHVARLKRLEAASEALKSFQLSEREYYMPWQLSGGQMQRVAIARALVNKPSLILADEPTGNLDSRSSHVIMEELSELHKRGNTIIMVTHNPNLTSYASRVIEMLDGKIALDKKLQSDRVVKKPKTEPRKARRSKASTKKRSRGKKKEKDNA
ncbi:ABC transporter [Candidatus Saccharibacteria bacterium]|nr:MAG: ABC transporter [Candidatus Saccharibacteria bacterium]